MEPMQFEIALPRLAELLSASRERPAISTTAPRPSSPTSPLGPTGLPVDWILPVGRVRVAAAKARRKEWVHPAGREAYLDALRSGAGWPLYFHGLQGRGKTTTALWFLDFARTGAYCTAREAIDHEFSPDWEAKTGFRRTWRAADLAVMDQFGMAGKQGPGQTQAILDLIDSREGRATIIVSNLPPEELGHVFDAQMRSRIEAGTKVEFRGDDYRILGARARQVKP